MKAVSNASSVIGANVEVNQKISDYGIRVIRRLCASKKLTQREIGEVFGVTPCQVNLIWNGKVRLTKSKHTATKITIINSVKPNYVEINARSRRR